jgi:glycosyltransferase involved in cell wall biosynthesis
MASRPRSILLVAQFAPPAPFSAARRVEGLVRYLARLGHSVTVVTSAATGEGPLEGADEVVRTTDLVASPLNWRRGQMDAFRGEVGAVYRRPSRLEAVMVPDVAVATWAPFALRATRKLVRARQFDCLITSSPPQSAHLVGLALRRHVGAWIAELRDGWTFDPPRPPWGLVAQDRLDRSLEARVVRNASALVAATEPIAADLRARFDARVEVITNGFDPEEAPPPAEDGDELLDSGRYSVVHTGRLSVSGRDPRPLFEALRALGDSSVELVLAGPVSTLEQELLSDAQIARVARSVGVLDQHRVRRLQRAADALLVVAKGVSSASVATGKLFEYLAAGPPILVLGERTEAARIVAETGAGLATSATDPEAIAAALRRLAETPSADGRNTELLARYSYPLLAKRYAQLIEDVAPR